MEEKGEEAERWKGRRRGEGKSECGRGIEGKGKRGKREERERGRGMNKRKGEWR